MMIRRRTSGGVQNSTAGSVGVSSTASLEDSVGQTSSNCHLGIMVGCSKAALVAIRQKDVFKRSITGGACTDSCSETFKGRAAGDTPEVTGLLSLTNTSSLNPTASSYLSTSTALASKITIDELPSKVLFRLYNHKKTSMCTRKLI